MSSQLSTAAITYPPSPDVRKSQSELLTDRLRTAPTRSQTANQNARGILSTGNAHGASGLVLRMLYFVQLPRCFATMKPS